MNYVIEHTHIIDHEKFLDAGALGRDLWQWGMLYAGKHETDGYIPMSAVMASPWGKGGKANVSLAAKLVAVGLWERTDKGYRVLRWAEMGNKTKAQIGDERSSARERMRSHRSRSTSPPPSDVRPNIERTSPLVPTSTSNSPVFRSGSLGGAGGARTLTPDEPLTDKRREAFAAKTLNVPARDADQEWASFRAYWRQESKHFASEDAIDGAWERWVLNGNKYAAKDRQDARPRLSARLAAIRQPLGDPADHPWLQAAAEGL